MGQPPFLFPRRIPGARGDVFYDYKTEDARLVVVFRGGRVIEARGTDNVVVQPTP